MKSFRQLQEELKPQGTVKVQWDELDMNNIGADVASRIPEDDGPHTYSIGDAKNFVTTDDPSSVVNQQNSEGNREFNMSVATKKSGKPFKTLRGGKIKLHPEDLSGAVAQVAVGEEHVHEAKDKGEYDYEGAMAMTQLRIIVKNAQELMNDLTPEQNLPEWVQSKITLAEDYITTAYNYVCNSVDEAAKWRSNPKAYDIHHDDFGERSDYTGREHETYKKSKADTDYTYGSLQTRPKPQIATKGPGKGKITKTSAERLKSRIKLRHESVTHPDEKEDKILIKKIVKKMLKVKEAYSDPYAAKKAAEIKKAHADTMADAKKEYDASKKKKFDKNFMKMKKEEISLDEVITKKTPTGEVISDFVHSKNAKFAGKSKKERIRMALGAKYAMMKKEEVELTELKNKTLRSYRYKAKIAAPTTRAPGHERAGEILKTRKDAHLAKIAAKKSSSNDRRDAKTKDTHPYGSDN